MTDLTRLERIECDIDARLEDLRNTMFEEWAKGNDTIEMAAALIRAAYGKGVMDALAEPTVTRDWVKTSGYKVPE